MHLPAHCTALLAAKTSLGLTFADISTALSKPEVWTTALFFGQAACDASTAQNLLQILKISSQYSFAAEDGTSKTISDELVVKGLTGASTGVGGMVQRGGTWDGVPKVMYPSLFSIIYLQSADFVQCFINLLPQAPPQARRGC